MNNVVSALVLRSEKVNYFSNASVVSWSLLHTS